MLNSHPLGYVGRAAITAAAFVLLLVVFGAGANASPLASQSISSFVERPGELEFTGEMIVRPLQTLAPDARARAYERIQPSVRKYYPETDEYIVTVPTDFNENTYSSFLMTTGDYQYAEPNWLVYPVAVPNDPQYPSQWHHQVIRSPAAWDVTTGNEAQIIAFTDTGIDLTHPDLAAHRVPGYNAADRRPETLGGQVNDINGHGTHVAGIGAAIGNNATGVAGVGWNFRIMMVRVTNLPSGEAFIDDLAHGARWAAENGAKTVSASYFGVQYSTVQTTGEYLKSLGALYLYAADNSNTNHSGFDWPDVIVVGATDQNDYKWGASSYGRAVDVFAPGVSILSTTRGGGYWSYSGTSMATPVANGVAALIWSVSPSQTPDEVEAILFSSAKDLGPAGNDENWGWGRVDAYSAVKRTFQLCPTTFIATLGLGSGTPSHMCRSDDASVTVKQPVPTMFGPAVEVVVEGVAPTSTASTLGFRLEAGFFSGTTDNPPQKIEFYDFSANAWTWVTWGRSEPIDTVMEGFATGNPSRFIQPGTKAIQARLTWFYSPEQGGGSQKQSAWIDQAVWLFSA